MGVAWEQAMRAWEWAGQRQPPGLRFLTLKVGQTLQSGGVGSVAQGSPSVPGGHALQNLLSQIPELESQFPQESRKPPPQPPRATGAGNRGTAPTAVLSAPCQAATSSNQAPTPNSQAESGSGKWGDLRPLSSRLLQAAQPRGTPSPREQDQHCHCLASGRGCLHK